MKRLLGIWLMVIVFLLLVVGWSAVIGLRNPKVAIERVRILKIISQKADNDIDRGLPWKWRYKAYDEISYEEMLFKFWIPIETFYDNHRCIR